jgi:phosphopantetheinyl transferase
LPETAANWLSQREARELAQWRNARRRCNWLLSRFVGKRLVAEAAGVNPRDIEILSRDSQGRVNRPCLWRAGAPLPWSLSISHTDRGVLVALAATEQASIGVDLTLDDRFSPRFAELWFTPAEQSWVREANSRKIGATIWAAKEALYKAVSDGESFAPREFEILADGQCRHRGLLLADCQLQSWSVDGHLAALAVLPTNRTSNTSCVEYPQ